jgi:cytochrome P450
MRDAEVSVPSGLELTALDPVFRENPTGPPEALRSFDPVHKDRKFDRGVLTRAKDVAVVFNDRTLAVDPRKSRSGSFSRVQLGADDGFQPTMLHLDDPEHKRHRNLVAKAFTVQSIEAMRGSKKLQSGSSTRWRARAHSMWWRSMRSRCRRSSSQPC